MEGAKEKLVNGDLSPHFQSRNHDPEKKFREPNKRNTMLLTQDIPTRKYII